jgi:hypothetical protein
MRNITAVMAVFLLALPAAGCSGADPLERPVKAELCIYKTADVQKDRFGPCTLEGTEINGHFAYLITFDPGTKVKIEYVDKKGWGQVWKINGREARGLELSREHWVGMTADMEDFIEWQLGSPETICAEIASETPPQASLPPPRTSDPIDKAFVDCVMSEARVGDYSSFDNGLSAILILQGKCTNQRIAWVKSCVQQTRETEDRCIFKAAIAVQFALKQYGK